VSRIHPTFSCFDDAIEFLEALAIAGMPAHKLGQYRLVHAVCVAPDGAKYAHAWVEHRLRKSAWLAGIVEGKRVVYSLRLPELYEIYQPEQMTRYTPREASRENYRTGTQGPWKPEYQALCSDERRVRGERPVTAVAFAEGTVTYIPDNLPTFREMLANARDAETREQLREFTMVWLLADPKVYSRRDINEVVSMVLKEKGWPG